MRRGAPLLFLSVTTLCADSSRNHCGDQRKQECCQFAINPESGQIFAQQQDREHAGKQQRNEQGDDCQDLGARYFFREQRRYHGSEEQSAKKETDQVVRNEEQQR